MVFQALIVTFAYYMMRTIDYWLGWQVIMRPMIAATVTGLILGDMTTGIIMGAALESLYMGVSAIGGVTPADSFTSAVVAVAYTVLSGSDMETGLALALPIGTLMASISSLTPAVSMVLQPYFMKLASEGKKRQYEVAMMVYHLTLNNLINCVILFLSLAFGVEGISTILSAMPAFVTQGLGAAGGIMTSVGLAMLATSIWSKETGIFVLLGFILAKYLGLSTLIIAVVSLIIAYVGFFRDQQISESKNLTATALAEGDDFYD